MAARTLTFERAPSTDSLYPFLLKDKETGTVWGLKGEAITGPIRGERLVQVPAHNACPLTGIGTLGVSGLLFNNNLIMYDRRDGETLYPQMIFKGVPGPRAGSELKLMPVVETTWGYWKRFHSNTKVIAATAETFSPSSSSFTKTNSWSSLTPQLGTATLTCEKVPSTSTVYPFMLKDKETSTTWNLMGLAVNGTQKGRRLIQVLAHNGFWFVWATFWQDTEIYTP